MANYLHQPSIVTIRCGANSTEVMLASGQSLVADLALADSGAPLEIISVVFTPPTPAPTPRAPWIPAGVRVILRRLRTALSSPEAPAAPPPAPSDARILGVAVKSIDFSGPRRD
jgi:hypothetical protein